MRQPSMQESVGGHIEYYLDNVYTSIPAVVMNVHNSFNDLRIDVQPSVNAKYRDGTNREHPVILNVPVQMPSSSTSAILFPLSKGDTVLLVFSQRGLDTFKGGNGLPSTPTDFRKFDKRDAVAIPGVWSFSRSPNNPSKHTHSHSTADMVVVHNLGTAQECEVRLKQNGDIQITTNQNVTVNSTTATVNADNAVITAPDIDITGDITLTGNITQTGNHTITGTMSATTVTQSSNNVTLGTHTHGASSPPTPGS